MLGNGVEISRSQVSRGYLLLKKSEDFERKARLSPLFFRAKERPSE